MSILANIKKVIIFLLFASIILFAIFLGSAVGLFVQIKRQLPDLSILKEYEPSLITKIYSDDGQLIAQFCLEKRILVPYASIPKHLIQAAIAVEDARFYQHNGIDWEGITRAAFRNLKHGYFAEGGSTITQQLTRSLMLHSEKTIIRKIKEALLAVELEKIYSKEKIIEMYLNQIYFGNGAYGVESAARTYFRKNVENLDVAEAALLAGLPKAPNTYNPFRYPEKAISRRNYVLKRMMEEGYIDFKKYQWGIDVQLNLFKDKRETAIAPYFVEYIRRYLEEQYGASALYRSGLKVYTTLDLMAQENAEKAVRWGVEELDKRQGYRKVIDDIVTMDRSKEDLQNILVSSLESGQIPQENFTGEVLKVSPKKAYIKIDNTDFKGILKLEDASWTKKDSLESILQPKDRIYIKILEILKDTEENNILPDDKKEGDREADMEGEEEIFPFFRFGLEQQPIVQGALIAIDPRTGHIKAMVGGYDFRHSKFNRAIQARRQPGSAFKPFIYTTALKQGYTLSDIFIDSPIIYEDANQNKDWKPANYYQKFYGPTTLREALEKSRNVITIKLLKEVGIEASIETSRKMGIESKLAQDLSLALGSSGMSLLELAAAYGVFATGGIRAKPFAILKVEGPDGKILEEHHPQLERVLNEQTAYLIVQALRGVVDHGTGWRAKSLGIPVAGKTGTTNNYIDAWFLGFTPELLAGVWVGFDEYKSLGEMETGSRAAAPVWVKFMRELIKDKPVKDFPVPSDISFISIDPKTGLLATEECPTVFVETFLKGTEPKKRCSAHQMSGEHFVNIDMDISSKDLPGVSHRRNIDFQANKIRTSD